MITRYAIFEGHIKPGQEQNFRIAVLEKILPFWKKMPGALTVRVCFEESRDNHAPSRPLILAINYPDLKAVENVMTSTARADASKATQEVLSLYFEGKIDHHVTKAEEYEIHSL